MQRHAFASLALFAAVFAAVPSHAGTRILEPMDVFGLQWTDNPRVSPDGRHIVYQRMSFDLMKDRPRSSLWTIDADGRNHRPLAASGQGAAGPPTASASHSWPRARGRHRSDALDRQRRDRSISE